MGSFPEMYNDPNFAAASGHVNRSKPIVCSLSQPFLARQICVTSYQCYISSL